MEFKIIAHIRTDFPAKFGVPRQSGLAETKGEIRFKVSGRKLSVCEVCKRKE